MSGRIFNTFIIILYIVSITAITYFAINGRDYYLLSLKERPHAEQHAELKPGGLWGHGFGVVGTAMILLLFLYSLRKRNALRLRFGKIRYWLNVHIFFGIVGPLLITLHTAGKLNGLVSVSYFSMLAVMFSGIIGRYIFIQIPRNEEGHVLALSSIDDQYNRLNKMLLKSYDIPEAFINQIIKKSQPRFNTNKRGLSTLIFLIIDDIKRPFRFRKIRRSIKINHPEFPPKAIYQIMNLTMKKSLLHRRKIFLNAVTGIFHLWHVVHKPFAWIMIIIMLVHVSITVLMGYKWVF
ncbi:MAG: hypothetical protein ABIJ12_04320 [bacterium]